MRQPRGVEILDAVTAKALGSDEYKKQLLDNPAKVLEAEGLEIPDGINIVIHENTEETIHLVLPSKQVDEIDLEEVDITIIAFHTGGI
jgi:hypothetical protein